MGVRTRNNMRAEARKRLERQRREADVFIHITPRADICDHEWGGWHAFDDGRGGETFCQKCGLGAMSHSLAMEGKPHDQ